MLVHNVMSMGLDADVTSLLCACKIGQELLLCARYYMCMCMCMCMYVLCVAMCVWVYESLHVFVCISVRMYVR